MPRFQYVALDARGQESTGSVEANSANEAIGHLRQAGYFPTGVYEEGKAPAARNGKVKRSEEHTSELQSQSNLVCRLLLGKKKTAEESPPARRHTSRHLPQHAAY